MLIRTPDEFKQQKTCESDSLGLNFIMKQGSGGKEIMKKPALIAFP